VPALQHFRLRELHKAEENKIKIAMDDQIPDYHK